MIDQMTLEVFLSKNNISKETWEKSGCDWQVLQGIGSDHYDHFNQLRDSADFLARQIQTLKDVHSVRWRVKDVEHLLEKIVRKRAAGAKKYLTISVENYHNIVTDLVGVRALHLFKHDCFAIDEALRRRWKAIERPVSYVREGDHLEFLNRLRERGFNIKRHPAGYRSIHYVVGIQHWERRTIAEVQVRTIFEEGWSEIDHKVRYPNFSDNEMVEYFLTIFNRMAGSADEMGGFVRDLAAAMDALEITALQAVKEKESALLATERALLDLERAKEEGGELQGKLDKVKAELQHLRRTSERASAISEDSNKILRRIGSDGGSGLKSLKIAEDGALLKALNEVTAGAAIKTLKSLEVGSAFKVLKELEASPGFKNLKALEDNSAFKSLKTLEEGSVLKNLKELEASAAFKVLKGLEDRTVLKSLKDIKGK
ncbi:RelA/SpoT domain-containing protein [Cupriavidus campinensis]|nr:RelA/SpoT domain-containing protein [Cupriavidus campinensis]